MTKYPDYVEKLKTKGTQVMKRNDSFYLYKVGSRWDPKKKRARKITEQYLGKITPDGLIASKHRRRIVDAENPTVKEFGASVLVNNISNDLQDKLKTVYANDWPTIFAIVSQRFMHNSPIKNMEHHFMHSYMSDLFKDVNLSPKSVSSMMEKIGADREKMVLFMRKMCGVTTENLIIDMTHIFSSSENINWLSIGHNADDRFHAQLNMLLIFSNDRMKPIYFRLLSGAIRDVSSIKETLAESKINNAIFVGDKGFHSQDNETFFESQGLQYILPIKRNNGLVDYGVMKEGDLKKFDGFFFFQKRHIWYKEKKLDEEKKIVLFYDGRLRTEEENSFLERISKIGEENKDEKEQLTKDFYEKQYCLGTICIITNTQLKANKIYQYLKARTNVEVAFDVFKNILEADKTYMQTDAQMYGWIFINFLSLILYYQIYGILSTKMLSSKTELISHYSPKDVVMHFSKVHKIRILGEEIISEIPKTTRILREKMGLDEDLLRKPQS